MALKTIRRSFLIILIWVIGNGALHPLFGAPGVLSLSQVYEIAVSQNEQIRIQAQNVQVARARHQQAVGGVLPQVSLQVSEFYQDNSASGGSSGSTSTFTAPEKPEYKVSLAQPLFSGFRDVNTISAMDAQIRKETIILEQSKRVLFQQIAQAYFQALLIQRDLKNIQDMVLLLQNRIGELSYQVRIGRSRPSDV